MLILMYAVLQVFVSTEVASSQGGLKALTSTGTSILVQGTLRRTPEGTLQVTSLAEDKHACFCILQMLPCEALGAAVLCMCQHCTSIMRPRQQLQQSICHACS